MKTHKLQDDGTGGPICGFLPKGFHYVLTTTEWEQVTCGRCLRSTLLSLACVVLEP